MDRVAVVAWSWFVAWIAAGYVVGSLVSVPGTGVIVGFWLALISTLAWPMILPERINRWMDDLPT